MQEMMKKKKKKRKSQLNNNVNACVCACICANFFVLTHLLPTSYAFRRCSPKQLLSRYVWHQELGGTFPLTVIDWLEGPVALAERANIGQVANTRRDIYSVLIHEMDLKESEY